MSVKKKILLTVAFVLATLVIPAVLLLLFVDALTSFAAYVVTFGIIIFAILGFIVISLIDINLTLKKTIDELKLQNPTIVCKVSNSTETPAGVAVTAGSASEKVEETKKSDGTPNIINTTKVNLNPAEPLVMPAVKKHAPVVAEKKSDDGFDDFQ